MGLAGEGNAANEQGHDIALGKAKLRTRLGAFRLIALEVGTMHPQRDHRQLWARDTHLRPEPPAHQVGLGLMHPAYRVTHRLGGADHGVPRHHRLNQQFGDCSHNAVCGRGVGDAAEAMARRATAQPQSRLLA